MKELSAARTGEMTRAARKLPAPTPGQAVTVPLELLPIYLAAHRLEAMSRADVRKLEQTTGQHKPSDVVMVKRVDQ